MLDWLVIVLTAGSLAIYGGVAFGYLGAKPGFVFLVVPLASMISIGLVLIAVRTSAGARSG